MSASVKKPTIFCSILLLRNLLINYSQFYIHVVKFLNRLPPSLHHQIFQTSSTKYISFIYKFFAKRSSSSSENFKARTGSIKPFEHKSHIKFMYSKEKAYFIVINPIMKQNFLLQTCRYFCNRESDIITARIALVKNCALRPPHPSFPSPPPPPEPLPLLNAFLQLLQ